MSEATLSIRHAKQKEKDHYGSFSKSTQRMSEAHCNNATGTTNEMGTPLSSLPLFGPDNLQGRNTRSIELANNLVFSLCRRVSDDALNSKALQFGGRSFFPKTARLQTGRYLAGTNQ
jgi:hypothetical protein